MRKNKIFGINQKEDCPGDALMKLYRNHIDELRKNVLFSKSSIDFFKKMADVVEKEKRILTFYWRALPEEDLPSLKIKVQKKDKQYELIYLKEKVNYQERQNDFQGRVTLNINHSNLRKFKKGNIIIDKKEEKER